MEKESETEPVVPDTLTGDDAGAVYSGDGDHEMGNT
jgi:hypothetical protein